MTRTLEKLSNDELVNGLKRLLQRDAVLAAEIVAHLAEVDERKLYLDEACSSLFVYCRDRLGMSEGMAYKRIQAARASRRFPALLDMLAAGELHLCGVCLLVPYLTKGNHQTVLAAAKHKSKRGVERLLAEMFPRPDVAATVRRLPEPKREKETQTAVPRMALPARTPEGASPAVAQNDTYRGNAEHGEPHPNPTATVPPVRQSTVVAPLSTARFKVQFTADQALYDKLQQARDLLRHQIPDGDIPKVLDRALDSLLSEVKRKRFAQGNKRNRSVGARETAREEESSRAHEARADTNANKGVTGQGTQANPRYVPAAVKREVVERDGLRCAYVDEQGRRCRETGFLEFQHTRPVANGGESTAANIKVYCRAHNQHAARNDFGTAHVEKQIRAAQQRRQRDRLSPGAVDGPTPVQVTRQARRPAPSDSPEPRHGPCHT